VDINVNRAIDPSHWSLSISFNDADLGVAFTANQEALFHDAFLMPYSEFIKKPVSELCTIAAQIAKLIESAPQPAATGAVSLNPPTP
jgi:hypothetical protein